MKRLARLIVLIAVQLDAHTISMSTGDLRLEGTRAEYTLRMPLYEAAHVQAPERELLNAMRFSSGGVRATLVKRSCAPSQKEGMYVCLASYEFSTALREVDIECRLARITVPTHVHLLRASREGRTDQAIFDHAFETATLRFREKSNFPLPAKQIAACSLLAVALALAGRNGKEILLGLIAFAAAALAVFLLAGRFGLLLPPRFVEAAVALAVTYVSTELLLLPRAGGRWAVAAVAGAPFGLFHSKTELAPGVALTVALTFLLWLGIRHLTAARLYLTLLLGVCAAGWFVWRITR